MYQKKIAYIDYIENGTRIKNAGHIKTFLRDREYMIDMQIKGLYPTDSMLAELHLKGARKAVGRLCINQGSCYYNARFEPWNVDGEGTKAEDIRGIVIPLSEHRSLQAEWQAEPECKAAETVKTPEKPPLEEKKTAEKPAAKAPKTEKRAEEKKLYTDKWEQLLHSYQTMNPFGKDNGKYINITPQDFVILREEYQELVHNSFLLHGFYNYGHIILGKRAEQDKEYYLGVPGTYHEREKMVAVMFGFEGFEVSGSKTGEKDIAPGSFGYYLRRVEL